MPDDRQYRFSPSEKIERYLVGAYWREIFLQVYRARYCNSIDT